MGTNGYKWAYTYTNTSNIASLFLLNFDNCNFVLVQVGLYWYKLYHWDFPVCTDKVVRTNRVVQLIQVWPVMQLTPDVLVWIILIHDNSSLRQLKFTCWWYNTRQLEYMSTQVYVSLHLRCTAFEIDLWNPLSMRVKVSLSELSCI